MELALSSDAIQILAAAAQARELLPSELALSSTRTHAITSALVRAGVNEVDSVDAKIARSLQEFEMDGASIMCITERVISHYRVDLLVAYTEADEITPLEVWIVGSFPLRNVEDLRGT